MALAKNAFEQFKMGMDIENWIERLEFSFVASGTTDENKKRALFLTNLSPDIYNLLKGLSHPTKLGDIPFVTLTKTLKDHVQPPPNFIMERFHFGKRDRKEGESVSQYFAEVLNLAKTCKFGEDLNNRLRDRIVSGINDTEIQKKLLEYGETLDFAKTKEIAIAGETAGKNVMVIKQEVSVNRLPWNKGVSTQEKGNPMQRGNASSSFSQRGNAMKRKGATCLLQMRVESAPGKGLSVRKC